MRLLVNTDKLLSEKTELGVKRNLNRIVDYALSVSPVDTGAYVKSFSLSLQSSPKSRSFSSDNLPTKQDRQVKLQEAKAALSADINSVDVTSNLKNGDFSLRLSNNAPHSVDVENGKNWRRDGYHVFRKIRSKFR